MSDFESKRIASGGFKSGTAAEQPPADPEWYAIKSSSLFQFAKTCAEELGAPNNWDLIKAVCEMGYSNGREPVRWDGVTYSGPMMLDLHRAAKRRQLERVGKSRAAIEDLANSLRSE